MKFNPFPRASGKRMADESDAAAKAAVQEPGAARKPRFTMLALEPRFMFDGAAVATAADAAQPSAPDATDAGGADESSHPALTERGEGSPAAAERTEVVFVDTRVPDYQSIVEAISPDAEVVLIDTDHNGVEQIAEALNGRADIDAIHIISHGDEGVLRLGNDVLHSGNLGTYSDALSSIGSALSADGDIMLYGCDVAKGDSGAAFIASLAEVTGADVAASDDATGAASMGGDWELEAQKGSVEAAGLSLANYAHLLANGTLTFTDGTGLGDGVATDGDGGSIALPGIDIEIRNISDVNGTPIGQLHWRDNSFMASADASYSGLTYDDGANGIAKGMSIKSSDGSEFQINGFTYYDWGATESATITVKGYRDGAEVASMTFEGWSGADGTYEPQNVSLDSTFDNVDDVRLYISAGGWEPGQAGTNHSINNIIIADAFVPNGVAGTIDFGGGTPDEADLGAVVTDGMGGSNDIPGITYQVYSTDAAGNPTGAHWHYYADLNVGIGGIVGDESNGDPVIVIDSAEGSEFWFKGITTNNYVGAQTEVTFEGFRDGVSTGSVTLSMDYLVTGVNTYTTADLPPSIFENVDEVRITNPNDVDGLPPGTKTNVIGLDAIVVDNPVATSAPTATNLTQSKSVTEGGSAIALDDIVVSDADTGETITATLTLSDLAAGALSTGTYGSATSTFNAGTGVWTVTGSVADVNAALAAVALTPSANNDQDFAIITRIRDAAGTGPADGTISLTVIGVNDAPTATNLTQSKSVTEGGSAVALDDIVVTDVDTGDTVTATLTLSDPAGGTLSTGTYGSATSTFNAGTGVWTVTGSVADVNAALAAVALTPSANNDQDFTITTRIRDAAGTGPADGTITVSVTAVNDAPVTTTSGGSTAYTENDAPVAVDPALTISDPDNATLASATVSITGGFQSGEDALAFTNDGSTMGNIAASYDAATGMLTLTSAGATATLAQWQAALRSVTYANTSDAPNTSSRVVSFTINDGDADSNTANRVVSVVIANDPPAISAPGTITVIKDTASSLAGISFADPDAGTSLVSVTLSVAEGTLSAASGGGVTVGGTASALTLTGSIANINAFIASSAISYTTALNSTADVTLSIDINDGGNTGSGGAQSAQDTVTINVSERPVVSIGGGSPSHTEDGASTVIAPALTITDSDSSTMSGATVSVTDFVSGDQLNFINQNGITGSYNTATGVLTLSGTATRAQYEAALRSITYSTTSDNPATGAGNADRVIEFRVSDGGLQSTAGTTQTVAISNSNDAPVLDDSASPALNGTTEDIGAPVNGSTADSTLVSNLLGGVSDPDSGALQGVAIVDTSVEGTLWYSLNGGLTWNLAPAVSETNALLLQSDARLYFQPAADVNGTVADAITFRAWDRTSGSNGGTADTTANGGGTAFSTATDTASIAIANVNDPPVLSAGTGSTSFSGGAGSPKTPVAVAPALTVTDPDPGETMASASIVIVGNYMSGEDVLAFTPSASTGNITASFDAGTGTLTLTSAGGTATLAQWQTALRSVTYANSSDAPSTSSRVISFTLNDGDADSNTVTRTVAVEVVNDPPEIAAPGTITVTEDTTSPLTGISFSDPDAGVSVVQVTLSVPQGALSAISGSGVTVGGTPSDLTLTGSIADINAFIAASGVAYTTAQDSTADVTLSIEINDLGNTGSGGAETAQDTATISVTGVNDGPVANGQLPDVSWRGAGSVTIPDTAFVDPDVGDTLAYSASLAGGGALPSWLHFDPNTRVLSGRPPEGSGNLSIVITATDSSGEIATSDFTLAYSNPSVAVLVPRQPPPMSEPMEHVEFTVTTAGSSAPLFTIGPTSSFVPGASTDGDWLQLTALETAFQRSGDHGLTALQEVVELRTPPGRLTYTLPADMFRHSDPDALVQLEARLAGGKPLPSWLSFDPETGSFDGEPPEGVTGMVVEVTARDPNGNEAKVRIEITIGDSEMQQPGTNPAPVDQQRGDLPSGNDERDSAENAAAPDRDHAAVAPINAFDAAMASSGLSHSETAPPAGKPSFSAQLAMARGGELHMPTATLPEAHQKTAKPS